MLASTFPLLLSVLPFTLAQYGGGGNNAGGTTTLSTAAAAQTSAAAPSVQTVTVGNGALAFSPDTITAAAGSTVQFVFYPPIHSVAQGDFATPCTPSSGGTGFFSGGFKTSSGQNSTTFTITVNDTTPIWFYCGYPGHCEGGMAGVINPPSDGSATLKQYQAAAANVNGTIAPKTVGGGVFAPLKAAGTSPSSTTTTSPAPTTSAKSAGVEARRGVKWVLVVITGVVAVGVGSLIV